MARTAPLPPAVDREAVLTDRRNRVDAEVTDLRRRITELDAQHHGHLVAGDVEAADELHIGLRELRAQLADKVEVHDKLTKVLAEVNLQRQRDDIVRQLEEAKTAEIAANTERTAALEEIPALVDAARVGLARMARADQQAQQHAGNIHSLTNYLVAIDHGQEAANEARGRLVVHSPYRSALDANPVWKVIAGAQFIVPQPAPLAGRQA
jgi:hypothetical protein